MASTRRRSAPTSSRATPAEGRWFPRVKLRADGDLAVRVRPAPPSEPSLTGELAGRETWLVSALHGIRAVTRWVGGPEPGEAPRAATWQRRLEGRCATSGG